jgi:hypothetical protein
MIDRAKSTLTGFLVGSAASVFGLVMGLLL